MRASDYDVLYDLPTGECSARGLDGVTTVTYRAGKSLEIMAHPSNPLTAAARREAKERRTKPAMEEVNRRNLTRHIMRVHEANFTSAGFVATGTYTYPTEDYGFCDLEELRRTYDERGLPWDEARADMDIRNFIERLKRRVKKAGGDPKALKWSMLREEGKTPPAPGLPPKYHWHALIEGAGVTREMIEACWGRGFVRAERYRPEDDGAMRLARYFVKQKHGRKWSHSRNLIIPKPTVSMRKLSRRRLAKIAADVRRDGKEILEKLYPGYRLVEPPEVRYSDFAAGCYIYARMRRME